MNYRGANSLSSFRLGNSILINNILDTIANYASSGALGLQGPQGYQGTGSSGGGSGFQGFQGSTGPYGGPVGPQGLIGLQGSTGSIGYQGLVGIQGSTGSKGNTGSIGPQGLIGFQGSTGNAGPQGFIGLQGSTGSIGELGSQGLIGLQGRTGSIGPQGLKGNDGTSSPGGDDMSVQYNKVGSFDGTGSFTYDYTNDLVSINGLKVNSKYSSKKWYSFKSNFTNISSPLQITITFDNIYFNALTTCLLTNTINVNNLTVCKTDCIGGTYDSSSPSNSVFITSCSTSTLDGSINWIYPSTTTTTLILNCDTNGDGNLYYNINIEVVNGSVLNISDNGGNTINFNY